MDTSVLLVNLSLVALAINRLIEIAKPGLERLPERYHGVAIRVTSIGLGVVITIGGGDSFNLLALSPVYGQLNPLAGLAITGVVVGGLSNAWDGITSLFSKPDVSHTETLTIESAVEHVGRE